MNSPLTIHVVGAQRSNYPWGFENRIIDALNKMGHHVLSTDFRQQRAQLPELLQQDADLLLVSKGEGIAPELIRSAPCPSVFWYAEQLGTDQAWDEAALLRRQELAFNASAFDYVFSHDESNLALYGQMGCRNVGWLPTAVVDPAVHFKLDLPKIHDVVFVGSLTPRRKQMLDALHGEFAVHVANVWDPVELNVLYNQSRIVLNIHLSDLLNTETRLCEVMGAGAFLLSEQLSSPHLFESGEQLGIFRSVDIADLRAQLANYLANATERERIAANGHQVVYAQHTMEKRLTQLLDRVDLSLRRRLWPSYALGITFDKAGKPTRALAGFYEAVAQAVAV